MSNANRTAGEGLRESVCRFLALEAYLLDYRKWDEWLALYTEDCEYWVPAWDGDVELTANPVRQVSLIYYRDRRGLEDRVFRLRTEAASSAVPQARTSHHTDNVHCVETASGEVHVAASWVCHWVWRKEFNAYAGRYEYLLEMREDAVRIKKKKTIVINDVVPRVLDFYHI